MAKISNAMQTVLDDLAEPEAAGRIGYSLHGYHHVAMKRPLLDWERERIERRQATGVPGITSRLDARDLEAGTRDTSRFVKTSTMQALHRRGLIEIIDAHGATTIFLEDGVTFGLSSVSN